MGIAYQMNVDAVDGEEIWGLRTIEIESSRQDNCICVYNYTYIIYILSVLVCGNIVNLFFAVICTCMLRNLNVTAQTSEYKPTRI